MEFIEYVESTIIVFNTVEIVTMITAHPIQKAIITENHANHQSTKQVPG